MIFFWIMNNFNYGTIKAPSYQVKVILLIAFLCIGQSVFSQFNVTTDTIKLKLNAHHEGKNYLSWTSFSSKAGALFLIEKRACYSSQFEICGVVERPPTSHTMPLGFWWSEEEEITYDYRVLILEKSPTWKVLNYDKQIN